MTKVALLMQGYRRICSTTGCQQYNLTSNLVYSVGPLSKTLGPMQGLSGSCAAEMRKLG